MRTHALPLVAPPRDNAVPHRRIIVACPTARDSAAPMRPIVVACLLVAGIASTFALAQSPAPYAGGDPKQGHALVDKDCHACHIRQFGDQDKIYTRADRRVKTPAQLRAQVAFCNTQLGAGYFPEEEEHIAAWLDQRYYRFKP